MGHPTASGSRGRPVAASVRTACGARANSSLRSSDTRADLIRSSVERRERVPGRARGRLARRTAPPAAGELQRSMGSRLRRLIDRITENQDLTPFGGTLFEGSTGELSGWEGCPASGVRARAGSRTAPRAGRRIRRAHVFDERCEEFALAPAARAAGPMRVARRRNRRGTPLPPATRAARRGGLAPLSGLAGPSGRRGHPGCLAVPKKTGAARRPPPRVSGPRIRGFRPCSPGGSGCSWRARTSRRRGSGGGSSNRASARASRTRALRATASALRGCDG